MPNEILHFLDGLKQIAREHPALTAIVAVVLAAGLFVLTDELVRSLRWHAMQDEQKARRALEIVNARMDDEAKQSVRAHQWH